MTGLAALLLGFSLPGAGEPAAGDLDGFGTCIERVADLDSDGVEDLAIGDPNPDTETMDNGCVWVLSGKTGFPIVRIEAPESDRWFGQSVAYLPSSSSASQGKFVVASITNYPADSRQAHLNSTDEGRVHVVNRGGALVKTLTSVVQGRRFGLRVSSTVDLDGDNERDFMVCAPTLPTQRGKDPVSGAVLFYSGKTCAQIGEIKGNAGNAGFASHAIITAPHPVSGVFVIACKEGIDALSRSRVGIYRAEFKDGHPAFTKVCAVTGSTNEISFGYAMSDLGDLDSDGWPEIAITAPEFSSLRRTDDPDEAHPRGRVVIVSTQTGSKLREISLSDKTGFFGTDVCPGAGTAWGGKQVLLVTSAMNVGSSAGAALLCVYALDSGQLLDRIDLQGRGGTRVVVLHGKKSQEWIAASSCDCDPEGFPGTVILSGENTKTFGPPLGRSALIAKAEKH